MVGDCVLREPWLLAPTTSEATDDCIDCVSMMFICALCSLLNAVIAMGTSGFYSSLRRAVTTMSSTLETSVAAFVSYAAAGATEATRAMAAALHIRKFLARYEVVSVSMRRLLP